MSRATLSGCLEQTGKTRVPTLCIELNELEFETLEQSNRIATVIRFRLYNQFVQMGDALVVLDGPEIRFHGMITTIEKDGWAVAADRRGSTIAAINQ